LPCPVTGQLLHCYANTHIVLIPAQCGFSRHHQGLRLSWHGPQGGLRLCSLRHWYPIAYHCPRRLAFLGGPSWHNCHAWSGCPPQPLQWQHCPVGLLQSAHWPAATLPAGEQRTCSRSKHTHHGRPSFCQGKPLLAKWPPYYMFKVVLSSS
jgi:hypothetical protein